MPISEALKKIYVTAPRDDAYIDTLELSHPLMTTAYITNKYEGFQGMLEDDSVVDFVYLPFKVMPPKASENAALSLQVVVDNTSRELMDELETLSQAPTDPITLVLRIYLESDLTTVQNDPPVTLDVRGVNVTTAAISFTAGTTNLRSRPFPSTLYTIAKFPGLER